MVAYDSGVIVCKVQLVTFHKCRWQWIIDGGCFEILNVKVAAKTFMSIFCQYTVHAAFCVRYFVQCYSWSRVIINCKIYITDMHVTCGGYNKHLGVM